jgi:hypothetical protein
MIEIYALCDPDSGEVRYVGKAKNAKARHKRHLSERHLGRPVNNWVKSLLAAGKIPEVRILAYCPPDQWEQEERHWIAKYRLTGRLLNLADGGAMPSQTIEQRRKAAKASHTVQQAKHPAWKAHVKAKQDIARLYSRFSRDTKSRVSLSLAAMMRFRMRIWAVERPELYGAWSNL